MTSNPLEVPTGEDSVETPSGVFGRNMFEASQDSVRLRGEDGSEVL